MEFNVLLKVRIFLIPLSTHFLIRKFQVSFGYENSLTWGVKYEKINLRKSQDICFWNPESGIQLKKSGIPLTIECRIHQKSSLERESGIRGVESRIRLFCVRCRQGLNTSIFQILWYLKKKSKKETSMLAECLRYFLMFFCKQAPQTVSRETTSGGPMYLEKRQEEGRRWQQAAGYINSKRTGGKLWLLEISSSSNGSSLIKHQIIR